MRREDLFQCACRIGDAGESAAFPQQEPFRGGLDDDIGDQAGKVHVVGPDRQQQRVKIALGVLAVHGGHDGSEFDKLRGRGARAGFDSHHPGTVVGALTGEHAGADRRPSAGKRDQSHGNMRLLYRKVERGADLITVERTMAGRIHPPRTVTRPVARCSGASRSVFAGPIVVIAGATRPEILTEAAAQKAPEAEAARQLHRSVRIAFAGCDRSRRDRR